MAPLAEHRASCARRSGRVAGNTRLGRAGAGVPMTPSLTTPRLSSRIRGLTTATSVRDDRLKVCMRYLLAFAPRRDAYARWSAVNSHWVAMREDLTPNVILRALEGTVPVSAYFPGADNSTRVLAIDIDLDVRPDGLPADLARAATSCGLPAYVEGSRRGGHVWMLLDEPVGSAAARRALATILKMAGAPDDPRIELRPAADRLYNQRSLGHALRMPMMRHPLTGERSWLFEPETMTPIARTVSGTLDALRTGSVSVTLDLAAQDVASPGRISHPRARLVNGAATIRSTDEVTVSEILRDDFGVLDARPGRTVRCPVHDDRSPSLSIARDDRRAWCHSPSCELNGDGRGQDAYSLAHLSR